MRSRPPDVSCEKCAFYCLEASGSENMNVLEQLKTDHENIATLLDILDDQVDCVRKMESVDYDLMRDIMHYMTTYPDNFHHPMEDLVMEKLIERDPSYRDAALSLVKEHNDLARKSKAFLDMLEKVIDGEIVLRKDIVARGAEYIEFLRVHMRREEQRFFPHAKDVLKEQDWKQISDTMEHRTDPVFGKIVEAQYKSIYEFIQLQSGV
jgi:hemerythrin-like domain-containing protein